jgi:hypothetical protein
MVEKKIEIGEIHLKTHLSTFVSNMLLNFEIMNFENVSSTKIIHLYVIKTWMHNINDIANM